MVSLMALLKFMGLLCSTTGEGNDLCFPSVSAQLCSKNPCLASKPVAYSRAAALFLAVKRSHSHDPELLCVALEVGMLPSVHEIDGVLTTDKVAEPDRAKGFSLLMHRQDNSPNAVLSRTRTCASDIV